MGNTLVRIKTVIDEHPSFRIFTFAATIISGITTGITHYGVWTKTMMFSLGLYSLLEGICYNGAWRYFGIGPKKIQKIIAKVVRIIYIILGIYFMLIIILTILL